MEQRGPFNTHKTWTLRSGNDEAIISSYGAVLLDWIIDNGKGRKQHLVDGYASDAELKAQKGARNAVMAPWSNRINHAKYVFEGEEHDFGPGADGEREAIHGLVRTSEFTESACTESRLELSYEMPAHEAYPWPMTVTAAYELFGTAGKHRLDVKIAVTNRAQSIAPVGMGWHAYFLYQGGVAAQARVVIDAKSVVVLDDRLIPSEGAAAFIEQDCPVQLEELAGIDRAYTNLQPNEKGELSGVMEHPNGDTTTLEYKSKSGGNGIGVLHLFTGESLADRPTKSLAIEPCLFVTNAFNRPECRDAIPLEPGKTRTLETTVTHVVA